MGTVPAAWAIRSNLSQAVPVDLVPFKDWFDAQDDARERFRWALRDSLDELLDGQRTGRWAYQHLSKTEKTYLGTAVEVNLTKEFEFRNGAHLDWQIAGGDIDCKFSKDLGGWEIPMEMYLCEDHGDRQGKANQAALVTWLNDDTSQWAAGLITVTDERLRWRSDTTTGQLVRAYNRDNKRRLNDSARKDIHWLWGGLQNDLPRNLLLHLNADVRARVFSFPKSGQARVNQLFREVHGRIVGRQTVLTVAQQEDAPKRARDARLGLRSEGILVLGHQDSHRHIARALELATPVKGEWIAVRVVPAEADSRPFFTLNGLRWAMAQDAEPGSPAPELPKKVVS
ncbi:NaeI family type II restriction endonuclease [Ornithinimicrobium sufpigmenti]|uniref:NaeI family type II restriction endonuclease n=1 Tax=Ornithinimicrobium sufpigmenti TaxID=2508882 RepID=UPI00104C8E4F|nr:NaeI family type II restriction endonuclease [Ornithinimicrobium sp. HY008]